MLFGSKWGDVVFETDEITVIEEATLDLSDGLNGLTGICE